MRSTYARWANTVPDDFRFAVKIPKAITHDARLVDVSAPLGRFLEEAGGLGHKLGVLLVQLPGRFEFDAAIAKGFFAQLRKQHKGDVVCEPRHPSWFAPAADALLRRY